MYEDEADGDIRTFTAPEDAGGRVDALLAGAWPDLSRSRIQGLIGAGKLSLNGALVTHASDKAAPGGAYALILPPPAPAAPQPEPLPLQVVYEDAHLIVIDKGAGMAMHPAPGAMRGTLVNALLAHCAGSLSGVGGVARPGIVHRIDKDTTGLVVAAKNDAAHAGLAKLFAAHDLERVYYAVTRGAPQPRAGVIDAPLARSSEDRRKMAVNPRGRRAVTHYWTIETFGQLAGSSAGQGGTALIECRLETGRTHQIRAHMAHIGAPLIGDPVYGKFRGLKLAGAGAAIEAAKAAAREFPRQALHAAVLGFVHPASGQPMRFESPLPADMAALLMALRAL
ncbi:MAG: RluA family pseudouridine synthase [Hyphomonadaceae bacterium]